MLRRRPLMRTMATTAVVAGTATAVSGGMRRHQDANAQQAAGQQQAAGAPPVEAPVEEDPYEALTKLGKLHEQGILTDEEFAAEKAKILG
jgi:Short C-terminal domain